MRIAAQAVELCNQKCRASETSMLERLSQFGPIVALAGLHFGVGLQELCVGALAGDERCGGGFLRFESKAGRALLGGADSVVGDKVTAHWGLLAHSPNGRKGKMQALSSGCGPSAKASARKPTGGFWRDFGVVRWGG